MKIDNIIKEQSKELTNIRGKKEINSAIGAVYTDKKDRVIIPDKFSYKILEQVHLQLGHISSGGLYNTLKSNLFIERLHKKCENVTKNCNQCQENKHELKKKNQYN